MTPRQEEPLWKRLLVALSVLLLGLILLQFGWGSLERALYGITAQLPLLAIGMVGTLFAVALITMFPVIVTSPDRAKQIMRKVGAILTITGIVLVSVAHLASVVEPVVLLALLLIGSVAAYLLREHGPYSHSGAGRASERKPVFPRSWKDV